MTLRFLKRHWTLAVTLLIAAHGLAACANRDLWFDEALTLMNFAMLRSAGEIYRQYVIPNNQILHTMLLHLYLAATPEKLDFTFFLRLLPCLTALGTLALLYALFRARAGSVTLLPLMTALAVSPPFRNYGTALRGYILSAFLLTASVHFALSFAGRGGLRNWALWFLCSLAAVGTIPSNLLALFGAVLYALPLCGTGCLRRKRTWILAATPAAAFAVFYLPIGRQLLQVFRLREGCRDGTAALTMTYAAAAVSFAVALIPVAIGAALRARGGRRAGLFAVRALIPLLPVPACLLLPVAPFPRVFFVLWPLWLLLGAGALRRLRAWMIRRRRRRTADAAALALTAAACLWGLALHDGGVGNFLSERFARGMDDDYFSPYYMRGEFRPRRLMSELAGRVPDAPEAVYLSFKADPWALMFYGTLAGWSGDIWRFDGPRGQVRRLPPDAPVILHADDSKEAAEIRFGRRLTPALTEGRLTVYF